MKPDEIKSFLASNTDLFSGLYANEDGTEICEDAITVQTALQIIRV